MEDKTTTPSNLNWIKSHGRQKNFVFFFQCVSDKIALMLTIVNTHFGGSGDVVHF